MAAYNEFADYGVFPDYNLIEPVSPDPEEERKKRERAAAKRALEVAAKQELITYADGSKTEKTTKEIPANQAYNASIAQQESSNRPNIGFHDKNKSSAYGAYGLTTAAYDDARRADPNLPADITRATPQQQTQAQNAYTQQNSKYLQNLGIEPTQSNLAAAHFLGAQGLSNYLKTGAVSAQAAQSNGGADNVRRIVDARLAGQGAPASGATMTAGAGKGRVNPRPVDPNEIRLPMYAQNIGNAISNLLPQARADGMPQRNTPPVNVGGSGFQAYDRNRPGAADYEGNKPPNVGSSGFQAYERDSQALAQAQQQAQAQAQAQDMENGASQVLPVSPEQAPPANVGSSGFQAYERDRPGAAAYAGEPTYDRNRPGAAAYEGPAAQQQAQAQDIENGASQVLPVSPEAAQAQAQAQAQVQAEPAEGGNAGQGFKIAGMKPGTPGEDGSRRFIEQYQANQNDPAALMKASTDETAPDWMRDRSRNRAADLITQQREQAKAEKDISTKTPSDLARMMTERKKDGSWGKYILFGMLGMTALRDEEAGKLGIGTDKIVTGADGKGYLIKVGANGAPIEGFNSEGRALTPEELITAAAGAGAGKWNTTAETYTDKAGNLYQKQNNDKGQTRIVNAKTNEVYKGDEALKRERDVANQAGDERKQGFKRENDATSFGNSIRKLDYDSKLKAVADFRQAAINRGEPDLTDAELSQMGVERPDIGRPTQAATATAPAQAAPAQAAPSAGPVAPTPIAGAAPTAVAPIAPLAPGVKPSVTGRITPEAMKKAEAEAKLARESATEVQTTEQKEFVKETKTAVGQTSSDGQAVSNARRQQLDIVKRNPSVINILNGQGTQYDQARRIMINAVGGAYGAEEKQQLANDLGQVMNKLTEGEQGALQEFVNLNTVVNAKTLRANAGPGAVSDAEQRANKEANVGNVDRIPAYAALAGLYRSQFNGDLAASKQAFLEAKPYKTTSEFNSAWQKQEAVRLKEYQAIAKARFDIMGRAPEVKAGPEAIKAYRNRVFVAFEAYPAPQYDAATNKWNYQTKEARRAAMSAI